MKKTILKFLRDDTGAVTVDSVGVIGGSIWMAMTIAGDIGAATLVLSEKIDNRLEYESILQEILDSHGPEAVVVDESDSGSDDEVDCVGNPGNDKCVGNAGENPNGQGGWGSGSRGRSD